MAIGPSSPSYVAVCTNYHVQLASSLVLGIREGRPLWRKDDGNELRAKLPKRLNGVNALSAGCMCLQAHCCSIDPTVVLAKPKTTWAERSLILTSE
jgi:hypothetical protein